MLPQQRWFHALITLLCVFVLMLFLGFFVIHSWMLLSYRYPLDYGEGPLLAQVIQLLNGTPIWQLYADPALPPYLVVNYPPVYPTLVALMSWPFYRPGDTTLPLLVGRSVSLLSTVGVVLALWRLWQPLPLYDPALRPRWQWLITPAAFRVVLLLAFLGVGIVREWAVVMRVDFLGVSLGLWALVVVQHYAGRRQVWWAAPLLALSLLTKPSLIAAPLAAGCWLLVVAWKQRQPGRFWLGQPVLLGVITALIIGVIGGGLQFGSNGWFWLHTVVANANPWDENLARSFWREQWVILWPLALAAGLSMLWQGLRSTTRQLMMLLPLFYLIFGIFGAVGIGKLGAYLNYFLEFYVGLFWCIGLAWRIQEASSPTTARFSTLWVASLIQLCMLAALMRYYPLWSERFLKPYGLIEADRPPRLALGRAGIWRDLRRERDVLGALGRTNAALVDLSRSAGGALITDIPGIAAQAGVLTPLQAFEHRMLFDLGQWDQQRLLQQVARGEYPLVVLDYLGNWLTPELIQVLTQRYVQEGSRGTYDFYRPLAFAPARPADVTAGPLRLVQYALPVPIATGWEAGMTLPVALSWQVAGEAAAELQLQLVVRDAAGQVVSQVQQAVGYGALRLANWPTDQLLQQVMPVILPQNAPAGQYQLELLVLQGTTVVASDRLTPITLNAASGAPLGRFQIAVPGPFRAAWLADQRADQVEDLPQMPAVPLAEGWYQCFSYACYQLVDGQVRRMPLGEWLTLADSAARPTADTRLDPTFLAYLKGREAEVGPAVTGVLRRGEWLVQYTRYARLERLATGDVVQRGPLGSEYLRLPNGGPYRWPAPPTP